jgi:hypothetical protein
MNGIERVTKLANELVKSKKEVAAAEKALADFKATMLRLEREDLPELMAEIGITSVKLDSGDVIEVKEDCDTKITEANKPKALSWLLGNGFGGIIKTQVSVSFGKGDHEKAEAACAALSAKYEGVTLDEGVHPQTLKAFVKERLAAADPLPMDLFGVFVYKKAVVK